MTVVRETFIVLAQSDLIGGLFLIKHIKWYNLTLIADLLFQGIVILLYGLPAFIFLINKIFHMPFLNANVLHFFNYRYFSEYTQKNWCPIKMILQI